MGKMLSAMAAATFFAASRCTSASGSAAPVPTSKPRVSVELPEAMATSTFSALRTSPLRASTTLRSMPNSVMREVVAKRLVERDFRVLPNLVTEPYTM